MCGDSDGVGFGFLWNYTKKALGMLKLAVER